MRQAFSAAVLVIAIFLLASPSRAQVPEQGLLLEIWEGIQGASVTDLTSDPRYPSQPTSTSYVTDFFEAPTDVLEEYGERMHGYLLPPQTGQYTFWIATDDGGALYLSTDENPANAREIASVSGWTPPRQWDWEPNQKSAGVSLVAGKAYYISAMMKEQGGGDNLAVRWLRPDGVDEGPIPGKYLVPFGTSFEAPVIAQNPVGTTAVENGSATFRVTLTKFGIYTYQWQRNGTAISGANGPDLVYGPVKMADHNARFRCVVSNAKGSTTSGEAVLTVQPDTTRPTLVAVQNLGSTTLEVAFSEAVSAASAGQVSNYRLSGGATVTTAGPGAAANLVLLTTGPLTFGTSYVLTVSGVQDQAQTPNTILPDSTTTFTASEYAPQDIGTPPVPGSITSKSGGIDVEGSGDFGGAADNFHFAWERRTGDFDMRVRLESLEATDPFAKAGLMARETLSPGSRFASALATPATVGCFSLTRAAANASAAKSGYFPANYPETWLRLKRAGNTFTAYASYDGKSWFQLSSTSLALPSTVYFGMAVSSRSSSAATAVFREISTAAGAVIASDFARGETLGPSSRQIGLVISEIMYHPKERADGLGGEFIEIYNADLIAQDLTGHRISGAVDFAFPDGTVLPAGGFAVIARNPTELAAISGIQNALGPFANDGNLPNDAGVLRLRNPQGAVFLEVAYNSKYPWPVSADGAGHSLVLARPSYGEGDPRAWGASGQIGGSPGRMEAVRPDALDNVQINEILAHTDEPALDFIELYNHSTSAVDLSGCVLTDDPVADRFRIPDGTVLAPGGFLAFDQNQLGFRLNAAGETVFLINASLTRVIDAVRFGPQENGVASGRYPDGTAEFRPLTRATPGGANDVYRISGVVINEIMFNPISGDNEDEYVELHNWTSASVDLAGWQLTDGIEFEFPSGATLASGGYLVVARDPARMVTNYPGLAAAQVFGPFEGNLANGGERLALGRPGTILSTNEVGLVLTNRVSFEVAEVTYGKGGRWGKWSDGMGSSLELIDPQSDHLRASNWADSDETAKAPWGTIEFTGRLDNGDGSPANRLHIMMQGPGECLVDDVEVIGSDAVNRVSNPGFTSSLSGWTVQGNHRASSRETGGGYGGGPCLHVRTTGRGDTACNRIYTVINPALANNSTATLRAKVRWLRGWPEFMLRTRGSYIEAAGRMALPTNLGTPGARNSRSVLNAGPAIFDVQHKPVLPAANQAVVVTARLSDPDGIGGATLRFRADPGTTVSTVAMNDNGSGGDAVAGDGVYSGTISGRSAGTMVAFHIQADDLPSSSATRATFPADAPEHECLVRWGESQPVGNLGVYRLWQRQADYEWLRRRESLANDNIDATFVYNDSRVVYNMEMRAKGSPWHGGSVGGDYLFAFPEDDRFLGAQDVALVTVGNLGNDDSAQREQAAFWIGRQMGVPTLHRRHVFFFENGNRKQLVYEDTEEPNGLFADRWWPEGQDGDLFKVEDWFEFNDAGTSFTFSRDATLQPFTTTGGAYKLARYRWAWRKRAVVRSANEYSHFFELVTAVNQTGANLVPQVESLVDMENWMGVFALQHIVGNWDAYGYDRGKNAYIYKPINGRFGMVPWDIDFVLGSGGHGPTTDIFGANDPTVGKLWNTPPFRRIYLRMFLDAIDGPLQNSQFDPIVDGRYAALTNNGVTVANPQAIKGWVTQRRNYLTSRIASMDTSAFTITSNGGADFSSSTPLVTLTGKAPIRAATITVNGVPMPVSWTSVTDWSMQLALGAPSNVLTIAGLDSNGRPLAGATDSITIRYTGSALPSPVGQVVISEIMYRPAQPGASFVEVHNTSTTAGFDISGWRLDGVDFNFPNGTILGPGGYAVVVASLEGFAAAYGFSVLPVGQYAGGLQNNGERLRLIRLGATPDLDLVVDELRYDSEPPWPAAADGEGPSLQLIDPLQDNWRVANWACNNNAGSQATPGRANSVAATLPAFPRVFLNEIQPSNTGAISDRLGDRDPWIELFNAGSEVVDLSGLYLTADPSNLAAWTFPEGTRLGANQFLLVWADGEPAESMPGELHTSFRLPLSNGVVVLSRLQLGAPAALDYIKFENQPPGVALGSYPDGQPQQRQLFHIPTPGAANNPGAPHVLVTINEWLAGNSGSILDPADGAADDWFELFNGGPGSVDLSGFTLTDDLARPDKFVLSNGTTIPAGGYLLVWADEQPEQSTNGQVHATFKLSASGETIGLFAPNGDPVDVVQFGAQSNDVSQGRFPDGMDEPFVLMELPSPGSANLFATMNQPPVLTPIGDRALDEGQTLAFMANATDPDAGQQLAYSLFGAPEGATIEAATGAFAWSTSEADGPGQYSFTVRATDNGVPARWSAETITVTVRELNQNPILDALGDRAVDESSVLLFTAVARDLDLPAQSLRFSLDPGAPEGATVNELTGEFSWAPREDQGPASYPVTLRVTDNAEPPGSAFRTFTITVNEIDNPPVFQPVSLQTVDELSLFLLLLLAPDPDTPARTIAYTLESGPPGLTVDSGTGLVSWTPTEMQGPNSYDVVVRASEEGGTQSSTLSFSVVVNEANQPPALSALQDWSVDEGSTVTFACSATDADLPAQKLSFFLERGAPAGASIDPNTGVFLWNVGADAGASTNTITVRVTDDAIDAKSASRSFTVVVRAIPRIVINEIMFRPATAGAEFVELHNTSSKTAWSLAGWRLAGTEFTFPAGTTLAPGGFLVIAKNVATAKATYKLADPLGNYTDRLGPNGGTIALWRPLGGGTEELVTYVSFDAQAPWPALANGGGASLQLIDPRQDNACVANWAAASGASAEAQPIFGMDATWRYWQEAADPASNWAARDFNNTSWPSGRGLLYVENSALPAAKNTLLTLGQNSYFFRLHFPFDGNPEGASLQFSSVLDDGAVFYLNGQPFYWLGMEQGDLPARDDFANRTVSEAVIEGPFTVSVPSLVSGENVLAVEVHQINAGSSDIVFGMAADLVEVRREMFTPGAANSVRGTLEPFPALFLNEVLALNQSGIADESGEREPWVELVNAGDTAVSLDGYSLASSFSNLREWTFPAGLTLAPGEHRIVWADGETAEGPWHASFRLAAPDGIVALARIQGEKPAVIDYLRYAGLSADESFGYVEPERSGLPPTLLPYPTPGAPNDIGPVAPEFLSFSFSPAGEAVLAWSAVPGRSYRLECTEDLADPAWQEVGQITASGNTASLADGGSVDRVYRFYRVILLGN
ncbi:MAG: lamin tail domain-containing protein [Verrucomicrobiia bacterium]